MAAATPQQTDGPRMKVELRAFSGEEADWEEWHKFFTSKARVLGFAGELVATDEIKVGAEDFNSRGIDPLRTKRASEAWLSLTTTCKGTALDRAEHRIA